jgi:nitrate reductase NapAB chaperone NapD
MYFRELEIHQKGIKGKFVIVIQYELNISWVAKKLGALILILFSS